MTMAKTENTREKKTMRKRARPLRGGSGAVTEEAREKEVRRRGKFFIYIIYHNQKSFSIFFLAEQYFSTIFTKHSIVKGFGI